MKIEEFKNVLIGYNFEIFNYNDVDKKVYDRNIEIWTNENKLVFVKEYRTKTSLKEWLDEDQPLIASLYDQIPTKMKNNIYFIILLDFDDFDGRYNDNELRLMVNKAEKDVYVCKKFVINNLNEISRIPFLNNDFEKSESLNYEDVFRSTLLNRTEVEAIANEKEVETSYFYAIATDLLEYYFSDYQDDNSETVKLRMKKIGESRWLDENKENKNREF